jgi:hypothetical protein
MPEPQEPKLDIEITAKDFDPNNPNQRPKGWADIKLRKVYLKEWQDRKDGVDEDEIMNRRYQRELEVSPFFFQLRFVLIFRDDILLAFFIIG